MKRSPMKPRTIPLRSGPGPSRGKRVKAVNPARRRKEWERAYGSEARVTWFRAQPCLMCGGGPSENCHTVTGGMSRKADAETIVPMCRACHVKYDTHAAPFDDPVVRDYVKLAAEKYHRMWQAHANQQGIAA